MTRVRVKICGITRAEDAAAAVRLGASALGFVFWPKSPRVVDRTAARELARGIPLFVGRVGVFVDATPDEVADTVQDVGLDIVQLHGDERVEDYRDVNARIVKTVTLGATRDVERAVALPPWATVLVDATDAVRRGGTGRSANWELAAAVSRCRPLILAGGLKAANVGEAFRSVGPWAIDVSSGVETAPGVKSADKMSEFFAAVAEGCRDRREDAR